MTQVSGSTAGAAGSITAVLAICHTCNSQVARAVRYQTGALIPAHLAEVAARQREVSQVIADGVTSGDLDAPGDPSESGPAGFRYPP